MNRRQLLRGAMALGGAQVMAVLPAMAATFVEQIVAQLQAQGFQDIQVERTWLGRARIQAMRDGTSREIVVNPTTGEILRDLWLSQSGTEARKITIGDDNGGHGDASGSGNDGSGGGGSGNSGHGGGDDDSGDDHGTGGSGHD